MRSPVSARHVEWTVISSADDLMPQPSRRLIDLALDAGRDAANIDLSDLGTRCQSPLDAQFLNLWPGEHYRLLAAMTRRLAAKRVIEVGTATGMSALALRSAGARVTTYDVVPWSEFGTTLLRPSDFDDGIEQRIGDLSRPEYFGTQENDLRGADFIFVDGPKNGVFERAFTDLLLPALEGTNTIVVFDDIRLMSMVALWRELPVPKLDATSLGHWSGTGLIHLV
jgi:predicted O-methyltransferase YrrM